tara:strand:+ start:791 stop:1069 length:279 start_codon:yes stop_codon:yes gene_type:complete
MKRGGTMDERVKVMFLERDYFILREGLQKLSGIIRNVETHYGVILGGEEIKEQLNNLLDTTAQRKYCDTQESGKQPTTDISDLMQGFNNYGV